MAAAENVSEDGAAALPIKEAIPSIRIYDSTDSSVIEMSVNSLHIRFSLTSDL